MNYDQLLDQFVNWAQTQEDIVGAIIVGSRARTKPPADQWSDLDLVIITTDVERYQTQTDWIAELGPYWVNFIEKQGVGEGFEHRVLFEGGMDVDFIPTPYEEIQQVIAQGWPPDWAGILQRGYKLILDKQDLAQQLPPVDSTSPTAAKPPTIHEFGNLCNDFLYHAVWAAKKLRRGELWIAKGCMDMYMKHLLLQMIEWHARATYGWDYDVWHRGRFLEQWADPRITDDLKQAFAHYDEADIKEALFATINLFRWIAQETAEKLDFSYPSDGDRQANQWLTTCLSE